ncbi:MAG: RIP metalloprotease RseP [Porticoccaceae bacterium]
MDLLQTIFYFFVALALVVTIHEFGHFWVARRCGVKVERFSIGFGRSLLSWRDKHNTEFVFALLPLGGYVKMVDERDGNVDPADLPYSFSRKTVWQRMAVVVAGPVANFILAIAFFAIIFTGGERGLAPVVGEIEAGSVASRSGFEPGMEILAVNGVATETWTSVSRQLLDFIGTTGEIPFTVRYQDSELKYDLSLQVERWLRDEDQPVPLRDLGVSPPFELSSLSLAAVFEEGAGYAAGLQKGDQLLSINGQPIVSINAFVETVASSIDGAVVLEVQRGSEQLRFEVQPLTVERDGEQVGQLGVQLASRGQYPPELLRTTEYSFWGALSRGVRETFDTSVFIVKSIGKLLVGDLSAKNLSGPITIAQVAGDSGKSGVDNFIRFVAMFSIMLGVMNLLPVPVLDGGHLMYYLIEVIKGSPVSDRIQIMGYKVGLALVMSLMVVATYNDIARTF